MTGQAASSKGRISLIAAIAIGIGGMVGAGVFSVLGVAAESAGSALWVSFLVGGVIALFSAYSYAKLGVRYPSSGGAVEFLVRCFGDNVWSGGISIYLWFGYVVAIALYAMGFASYFGTFFSTQPSGFTLKLVAMAVVALFTLVNFLGAKYVGRSETFIVAVKVTILVLFAVTGLFFIKAENLSPSSWPGPVGILYGAGILFIGYEGFGLIANTAGDMKDPRKMLPRAIFLSVFIVIALYIVVALAVSGNLTAEEMKASRDFALAAAAKPFLHEFGFKLIAIAALFSTASAINATLYGGANVIYMVAKLGELPRAFARKEWRGSTEGLFITAAIVIAIILLFDLSAIAMMGSGAFLFIYAVVNAGHLRKAGETGARRSVIWIALILCLGMFGVLCVDMFKSSKPSFVAMISALAACFLAEWGYRKVSRRTIKIPFNASMREDAETGAATPSPGPAPGGAGMEDGRTPGI